MIDKKYIFTKVADVDKELFAQLLMLAKGNLTMKDFADKCGVNPSTFTRIIQMSNKGSSSPELIQAIAKNAEKSSKVTLEKLAAANGYKVKKDIGLKIDALTEGPQRAERLVRDVITQELINRNKEVRMGSIRYPFTKNLELRPDALIMTDAFGKEKQVWFLEALVIKREGRDDKHVIYNARHRAFDKISRFVFVSMNKVELFRPERYSLVVFDEDIYKAIVEEFEDTVVPTDISIILIDPLNSVVSAEFMLPHKEKGNQASFFMTEPTENFYRSDYYYDDEDEEF